MSQLGSITEIGFLCGEQTLDGLRGKEGQTTEELQRRHANLFYSALTHFGTIKGAFAKLDVRYPFTPLDGWEDRIQDFLGKLPDTVVAECVGVRAPTIGRLRRRLDIPRFTKRRAAEAEGIVD